MTVTEYNALTEKVIGIAIAVHRRLGPGQDETLYEEALQKSLLKAGIACERQVALPLVYEGTLLDCGYRMDLLVEGVLVIELKTVAALQPIHEAQLLTYLRLSGHKVGLLINFNVLVLKDGIRRRVHGLGAVVAPFKPWFLDASPDGTTDVIINAAIKVHSTLGPGLLRSTYQACLAHELELRSISSQTHFKQEVCLDDMKLDQPMEVEFIAKTEPESLLPILVLSVDAITRLHEAQFRSKLRLAGWTLGLILNFNAPLLKEGIRRITPARFAPQRGGKRGEMSF